jgi:hypothetical protein
MKTTVHFRKTWRMRHRIGTQARASMPVLLAVFLMGAAVAVLAAWLMGFGKAGSPGAAQSSGLSEATLAVLGRMQSNVTIRFYAVLDPASTAPGLTEFTGRVHQLLSEFERASSNKVRVTRFTQREDSQAASADGLTAFNIEKGDACFLGIAVVQGGARESLARLSPDWEAALEYDLSRAIDRVGSARMARAAAPASVDPAIVQSVKSLLPNPAAVSLEEGQRALRERALADLAASSQEMDAQVKAAESKIAQARAANAEEALQAAVRELIRVRSEQTEKLKEKAAQLQAQLDAWDSLKQSSRP